MRSIDEINNWLSTRYVQESNKQQNAPSYSDGHPSYDSLYSVGAMRVIDDFKTWLEEPLLKCKTCGEIDFDFDYFQNPKGWLVFCNRCGHEGPLYKYFVDEKQGKTGAVELWKAESKNAV